MGKNAGANTSHHDQVLLSSVGGGNPSHGRGYLLQHCYGREAVSPIAPAGHLAEQVRIVTARGARHPQTEPRLGLQFQYMQTHLGSFLFVKILQHYIALKYLTILGFKD